MKVSVTVGTERAPSARMRQVASMFDCPVSAKMGRSWEGDAPIEDRPWKVGLIVGPSGCGKSTIARHLFGPEAANTWGDGAVVDEVSGSIEEVTGAFSAVGFNTIPAWLRPYQVLSNGERFRADLARTLLEARGLVWVDEFTSVVDRQVAKIGSHAVQKYVRRGDNQLVAVSCHYDVIDWLQPDWILEPATMTFTWRSLQPRPTVELDVKRTHYGTWRLFAPYHYLTGDLNRSATCFAAHVGDRPVAFVGVIHMPHPKVDDIKRVSRLVTLPDWQGIGAAFALVDELGSAYSAVGYRLRTYPAHPGLVRSFRRSPVWRQIKAVGEAMGASTSAGVGSAGGRPCAIFEYEGPKMAERDARLLMGRG